MRRIIGSEGEDDRDYDFLSSVEVLVVDQLDIVTMQNLQHLQDVFAHLNLQPKKTHGVDFSRVLMWALNGHGAHFRQTILLSNAPMAEANALFNRGVNYCGRLRVLNPVTGPERALSSVFSPAPMLFHRINPSSLKESPSAR